LALSYATNRTNLELRLSTQAAGDAEPAISLAPSEDSFGSRHPGRSRPSSTGRPSNPSASDRDDPFER
jgi:hypothetical protein